MLLVLFHQNTKAKSLSFVIFNCLTVDMNSGKEDAYFVYSFCVCEPFLKMKGKSVKILIVFSGNVIHLTSLPFYSNTNINYVENYYKFLAIPITSWLQLPISRIPLVSMNWKWLFHVIDT